MKKLESFNDSKYVLSTDEQTQLTGGAGPSISLSYEYTSTEDPDTCETSSDQKHVDTCIEYNY